MKADLENINIGLSEKAREEVTALLFKLLSDDFVIYVKARNYHWNVVGKDFLVLHEFFKKIYEDLEEEIDEVAERIRTLGKKVPATMKKFLETTDLSETSEFISDKQMLENLLNDYEVLIKNIRTYISTVSSIGDEGTANFLTDLLEKKEKTAWMIRAMLEK